MARPGCKRQLDDGVNSLHKRIRHLCLTAAAKMEILIKGPASMGHFSPEVSRTPIDCQAIFLSPAAKPHPGERGRPSALQG